MHKYARIFFFACWYNRAVNTARYILCLATTLLFLSACSPNGVSSTPTSAAPPAITPYHTPTSPQMAAPTATAAPTFTPPPLPTPTPFMYTVVEGNTMIGIALNFGLSLEQLQLANPDVNPNFLSVGTQLVIPQPDLEEDQPGASSNLEIMPLETGSVNCLPDRLGGLWCLWPVANPTETPVENLAGLIRLFDRSGEETASQPVYHLLNLLLPGKSTALAAYFPSPPPDWQTAQAQLTGASAANQVQQRYLTVEVTSLETEPLDQEQTGYAVTGAVSLSALEGDTQPAYLWALAIAYDAEGQPVGIRRWEAGLEGLSDTANFSYEVYSQGSPIERVAVLVEAAIAP